jgi:hypothetical protein
VNLGSGRSVHLERLANSGQSLLAYVTTRSVNLRVWSSQKVYGKAPILCGDVAGWYVVGLQWVRSGSAVPRGAGPGSSLV